MDHKGYELHWKDGTVTKMVSDKIITVKKEDMQSNEAYKKLEKVVVEIDPTGQQLADLIVEVLERNYLSHSMVQFYDVVDKRLFLKVAQIKYKTFKDNQYGV